MSSPWCTTQDCCFNPELAVLADQMRYATKLQKRDGLLLRNRRSAAVRASNGITSANQVNHVFQDRQ
eukprot:2099934-Amphidinium_carterae.1